MPLLSEVARTGRRFRRTTEPETWFELQGKNVVYWDATACGNRGIWTKQEVNAEMLVANDWESEPRKIEVTAADLLDAARAVSNDKIVHQRRFSPVEMMRLVIDELGLKEG